MIPKLNSSSTLNDEDSSWIGSLLTLGSAFGPFLFGYAVDKFGRKLTLISLGVPFLISSLILAFAKSIPWFYAARFLMGISVGGSFTIVPMYIAEIAEDSSRGALSSVMNVMMCFGELFSYGVGPYVSILVFNAVSATFPVIFMISFFFIAPESPFYLVLQKKDTLAEESLRKLRGVAFNSTAELSVIKEEIAANQHGSIADLFRSKGLIKALIISISLVTFQQFSGITPILFYAETIFQSSDVNMNPEYAGIIIGGVQVVSSFITPLLIDKAGRKLLLYFSSIGMLVAEVLLGLYFYLEDKGDNVDNVPWLPIVSLIFYIIAYSIGLGPLPWTIIGELFPSNVKSFAASITTAFCWIIGFIITKFFTSVVERIGLGPSFWLFSAFCASSFFFTFIYVVETKGKSLKEIQEILKL